MGDWHSLRRFLWAAVIGLAIGSVAYANFGKGGAWLAAGAVFALAIVASIVSLFRPPPGARDTGGPAQLDHAILPPMARDLFERLPDPLLLIDTSERVILANSAMRGVVGIDAERKHISAIIRAPAVLEAIRKTAETGEAVVGRILDAGSGAAHLSGLCRARRIGKHRDHSASARSDGDENVRSSCAPISSPMRATNCARHWPRSPASSRL
ncbi:MAG: hypothetical protein WDM89_15645 [Rhizomicrobium sp.]